MGCGCTKATAVSDPRRQDEKLARQLQAEEDRRALALGAGGGGRQQQHQADWGASGPGRQLGGSDAAADANLSAEERRLRALEAAERRQNNIPGVSPAKAAEMREKQQKQDLLGKLTEYYARRKMEMPMGLNTASVEQLRKHWEQIRSGDTAAQVLAQ
mmetsp:Transcript_52573/g.151571  ORF Transcript_52573/g.151571 Transcript_52573/m.151571 type:complete len:158 (+) Transcript_52573:111-584(+)